MRRALVLAALLASCSSDPARGGPGNGGGGDGGGGDGGGGGPDGGADAPACSPANPIAASFGEGWLAAEPASVTDGVAVVAPGVDTTGSIGWAEPHSMSRLEAAFEIRIRPGATMGEGLVFVWTAAEPPVFGAPASNMGACGLGGYGVAFDTAPESGGGVALKLLRLEGVNGCPNAPVATATLSGVADNAFHPVRVVVAADGKVDVTVDGEAQLSGTLPAYRAFDGYVMFTAATSTKHAEHAVRAPKITFPDEPRCP
jgi:hypothetical protein